MKLRYVAVALLAVAQSITAQVAIKRDGSLPPPSVSPRDYPALVGCTLEKRRHDIEAILVSRQKLYDDARKAGRLGVPDEEYGSLIIVTGDGRRIEEARLFTEIVESCHRLKVGYPLGFWPERLYRDWGDRIEPGGSRRLGR